MKNSHSKVLLVCPSFPYPESGAEQADRAAGIRQLVRLGYEVVVLAKVTEWTNVSEVREVARTWGIVLHTVPYRYSNRTLSYSEKVRNVLGRLLNPKYLDGAAYEYAEPVIRATFRKLLEEYQPNIVWFEYTYLWPLYKDARQAGAKIVTRSINFEPTHFLEEDGRTFINYLKYIPKYVSERLVARLSDLVVALNPSEAALYRRLGAKKTVVVPLRSLPALLRTSYKVRTPPLLVLFMGSSYLVTHNREALSFVIKTLAPEIHRRFPGEFVFHVFGSKVPDDFLSHFNGTTVTYEGYKEASEFNMLMDTMDIALAPSVKRVGMQQKVYEPLARAIPLITHPDNMVGYSFKSGEHYLSAGSLEEYLSALDKLRSDTNRHKLSASASTLAHELFSQSALDATVRDALVTL